MEPQPYAMGRTDRATGLRVSLPRRARGNGTSKLEARTNENASDARMDARRTTVDATPDVAQPYVAEI
eukprot:3936192-Prymnesium_polylepis.1